MSCGRFDICEALGCVRSVVYVRAYEGVRVMGVATFMGSVRGVGGVESSGVV